VDRSVVGVVADSFWGGSGDVLDVVYADDLRQRTGNSEEPTAGATANAAISPLRATRFGRDDKGLASRFGRDDVGVS
jgi:hypothetical protein